jgi:hypothetical protein
MTAMSNSQEPEYLTRAEIPQFLARHGFPIGRSTIDKLSMPSRGANAGPKPAGLWGNRHLYRPSDVLRWARNRFRTDRRGKAA